MKTIRTRISSRLIPLKILGIMGIIGTIPLVFLLKSDLTSFEIILCILFFMLLSTLIVYWSFNQYKVEVDEENFYLNKWNMKQELIIPFKNVSAFLMTGLEVSSNLMFNSSQRIIYSINNEKDKDFWLHPALSLNTRKLRESVKKVNPKLIESKVAFIPFGHFIFRDKKWY